MKNFVVKKKKLAFHQLLLYVCTFIHQDDNCIKKYFHHLIFIIFLSNFQTVQFQIFLI